MNNIPIKTQKQQTKILHLSNNPNKLRTLFTQKLRVNSQGELKDQSYIKILLKKIFFIFKTKENKETANNKAVNNKISWLITNLTPVVSQLNSTQTLTLLNTIENNVKTLPNISTTNQSRLNILITDLNTHACKLIEANFTKPKNSSGKNKNTANIYNELCADVTRFAPDNRIITTLDETGQRVTKPLIPRGLTKEQKITEAIKDKRSVAHNLTNYQGCIFIPATITIPYWINKRTDLDECIEIIDTEEGSEATTVKYIYKNISAGGNELLELECSIQIPNLLINNLISHHNNQQVNQDQEFPIPNATITKCNKIESTEIFKLAFKEYNL